MAMLMTVTIVFNTFSGTAFATEAGEAGTVVSSESETTASETDSEAEVETEAEAETEAGTETSTKEDTEGSTEVSTEENSEGATEERTEGVTEEEKETAASETTTPEVIAVTGITLDQTTLEVGVGAEPVILTATVLPEDAADKTVTWSSSDPGVASVDENGVVTFGYMGEAVITATAGEFSASCTVNVGEGETVVYADDTIDYLFLATDRHTNTSIIATMINNMEKNIGENELDYLGLGGDMVGSGNTHPAYDSSTVLSEVTGATSSLSATNVDIVAGIHDMNVNDDAGIVLKYQGGGAEIYEGNKFYVYGVEEYCISEDSDSSNWSAQAQAFVDWANGADIDKSKVIIVLSHYPLHQRRDDNDGASYWVEALNKVAAGDDGVIDRDVAFFWGHNHTGESSADTAVYHVKPNGTISVQGGSSSQTIYFSYANAGYLNAKSSATLVTITDTEIKFEKYVNSSVSTTNTVTRIVQEETKTLTSIDVTGTTEYTLGDNGLALTVMATYDDGTTANVTADATFEPSELTASGTYTVTVSYGGETDTIDVTVNLYDEVLAADGETLLVGVTAFSQGATALEVTWDDAAEAVLDAEGLYTDYVVYDLALTNPGDTTEYALTLVENMDTTNLAVYHVADDGTLTLVPHTIENDCVVFTTSLTGAFAYGSITVPEGYTLSTITLAGIPTDLFVGGSLDMLDAVITATYTKEGAEDYVRQLTVYDYDETNFSGYDVNVAGAQTAVFTFDGVTATLDIQVWGDEFTVNNVTVHVGEYGVTEAVVTESTNANVATAIQNVITGDNYVAYDITLTYSEGYAANAADKTVTLPIPDGVTNPVVYYVSDSGKSVVDMKAVDNGDGTVTFTTDHFSTYVLGDGTTIETESGNASVEGSSTTTTEEKTVYVKVDAPVSGEEYLIVSTSTAGTAGYVLGGSSVTPVSGTLTVDGTDGTYTYIETTGTLWTASGSGSSWSFANGSNYLGYTQSSSGNEWTGYSYSYEVNTVASSTTWTLSDSQLYIYLQSSEAGYIYGEDASANYYLTGGNSWSMDTTAANVYFYKEVTATVTTTTGTVGHTYSTVGTDIIDAIAIKDQTVTLSSILYDTPEGGTASNITASSGLTPTYEVVTTKGNPAVIASITDGVATLSGTAGTAVVKVTYTSGDLVAWDEFIVTATAPDHYSIQLHLNNDGTLGEEITEPVALKGVKAGDTYSVWAVVKAYATADDTTGTDIGTLGNALSWTVSDTSIATIDTTTGVITFTGNNFGTFTVTVSYEGADGKVITDTITISATDTEYIVPGDGTDDFREYPNEGAVRFDKTATAVGNYSETGIAKVELSMTGVPYSTGSEIDVVVMLDMTGSMSTNGMAAAVAAAKAFVEKIVKNEDGTYNDNRVAVYQFNSTGVSTYFNLQTISSDDELTTAQNKIVAAQESGGTPFDTAAQYCHDVLAAAKTTNLPEGVESADDYNRQQFCVFMSDGGPTTYKGSDGYTYYGGNASGDRKITNYIGGYTSSTSSSWTYNLPTEYWTDDMKADGVTIYTVGLLLQNVPSNPSPYSSMTSSTYDSTTDSLTSIGSHYYFTSTILKKMATDESKYIDIFSVDKTDKATAAFTNIATSIREAATDVVVEDKIGNDYTINFGLPGYGTSNALDATALDGLSNFYIQVVDYTLDSTTHERTDTYTVKENFTFNLDGTLASHTVDGAACGTTCNHVTFTDGVITAIDGTYFDYKSDSTGEYLTWEADKLTSNELALQYFAYLDNSSGVATGNQKAPGTYYTNEYATLTYTNVNGNRVQQEFPVPQMTWYGAQVSYVFYLVNEAGQPVNRAGRVVPFAEAVYVTDVYTEAVVWNDLEQSAGLEASRLAVDLVPDVYALYDDDASYNIHVYADEDGVNLNNHFIIGGNVADDYNTNSWTNAKTTYVFNNKSDGTKYYTVGTYIANDGSDTTVTTTYLCKGAGTISGVTWSEVTLTSDSDLVNGAYYYLADGIYTRALTYTEGTTYYQLTAASYTAASGETQWKPGTGDSTTGGTVINGYVYYVDEKGVVYTIVQKSNGTEVHTGFDFANTTVAFAVVWKPALAPDTVVIDYGLDVVIDVIKNDNMAAGVTGVMLTAPSAATDGTYETAVGAESVTSTDGIWTASVENLTSVRFSLNNMEMSAPAEFFYEASVNYYKTGETGVTTTNMYSSVTVIPATTVYYEDDFLTLTTWDSSGNEIDNEWVAEVTAIGTTQDQDRPGASQISASLDADNNYGYDSAYKECSMYSLGSAAYITVDSSVRGIAEFTFYGTGFDIIGLTSNTTGTLIVQVYDSNGGAVKTSVVDTYYGYACQDGKWVAVDSNSPNALYQVPVMKIYGLTYGKYTVKLTAGYNEFFDETGDGKYTLYLDAVRIYDPCGSEDTTANNAYVADGEAYPKYTELRNEVITAESFNSLDETSTESVSGIVFIDGATTDPDEEVSISDYTSYGPNNELYLAHGQAVAFDLNATATNGRVESVQLAVKTVGGIGSVEIYGIDADGNKTSCLSETISTATDMYYDITALNGKTVVIKNSGESDDAIVSLTNIKVTYTASQPAEETEAAGSEGTSTASYSLLSVSRSSASYALMSLSEIDEDVEETEPEITESEAEETEVETTESEAEETEVETTESEAEETEVETTESEAEETEAETTESETEETEAETTESEPEETEVETTESEPEETEAETTESEAETTEPEAEETEAGTEEPETAETEAETSEPEANDSESLANIIKNVINKIRNTISSLFGRWFK